MTAQEISARLQEALPQARIDVRTEDNTHFEALVVDAGFAGMRSIARHQRVYQILGDAVGREIHALALKTMTPDELDALQSGS